MKKRFFGCDENCFECIYPDCLKPAKQIHSDNEEEGRGKKNRNRKRKGGGLNE